MDRDRIVTSAGASHHMKLLSGNANLPLAQAIADYLDLPLTEASVRRFADEEVFVEINEHLRGDDVFVHANDLNRSGLDPRKVAEGARVQYDTEPGKKGVKAVNVRVAA